MRHMTSKKLFILCEARIDWRKLLLIYEIEPHWFSILHLCHISTAALINIQNCHYKIKTKPQNDLKEFCYQNVSGIFDILNVFWPQASHKRILFDPLDIIKKKFEIKKWNKRKVVHFILSNSTKNCLV